MTRVNEAGSQAARDAIDHGTALVGAAEGGALVSDTTLSNSALFMDYGNDTDFTNVGGLFDFEIRHVSPVGSSVQLVIPLRQAIPADASYRKLSPTNGWQITLMRFTACRLRYQG